MTVSRPRSATIPRRPPLRPIPLEGQGKLGDPPLRALRLFARLSGMSVLVDRSRATERVGEAHADDGAIFRDQDRQSRLPAVLPDGRFLRAVLRRRRDRQPRARHRADQARQAPGRGHPHVRRADRARRRLSAAPDRARPSRRGLRADSRTRRRRRSAAPKSVVRRDVVRLVTPGTITEERLLEPGRANALLAIQRIKAEGERATASPRSTSPPAPSRSSETDEAGLALEIARLEPREIVAPQSLFDDPGFARLVAETRIAATPLGREASDAASAERRVCEFYGVETLDGFGAFSRAEIAAAALALAYVERTQIERRPALAPPSRRARGATLEIDAATRANLELTRTLAGERAGSLLATIDLTKTPAGARLIAERLASPLTDLGAIAERLDAVGFFVEAPALRDALRGRSPPTPDFLRALARLGARSRRPARSRGACATAGAPAPRSPRCSSGGRLRRPTLMRGLRAPAPRRRRARARARRGARRRAAARQARRRLRARGLQRELDEARALARREPARDRRDAGALRRGDGRRASSRSSTTISSASTSRRRRRRARRC